MFVLSVYVLCLLACAYVLRFDRLCIRVFFFLFVAFLFYCGLPLFVFIGVALCVPMACLCVFLTCMFFVCLFVSCSCVFIVVVCLLFVFRFVMYVYMCCVCVFVPSVCVCCAVFACLS